MGKGAIAWTILSALALAPAALAGAATFQVDPINVVLGADQRATAVTIRNKGGQPAAIRIVAVAWRQEGGRDVLTPTDNVIISPPIFTVQPGGSQLARVALRARGGAPAYRLVFEEIPGAPAPNQAVQVLLRLDLPLYLVPRGGGAPQLAWSAWRAADGELVVEGANGGTRHAQIVGIDADGPGRTRLMLSKNMAAILPGGARLWRLGKRADFQSGAPMTLRVREPGGETQVHVVVGRR